MISNLINASLTHNVIFCIIERRILQPKVKIFPSFEQALGSSDGQPCWDVLQNRERLHQPLSRNEDLTNRIQSFKCGFQVDVVPSRDGYTIDDLQN